MKFSDFTYCNIYALQLETWLLLKKNHIYLFLLRFIMQNEWEEKKLYCHRPAIQAI